MIIVTCIVKLLDLLLSAEEDRRRLRLASPRSSTVLGRREYC